MTFKKELLKNILFKGLDVLLSFVVTILLVRLLGTEGNGIYSLFIANAAIISLIISFSFTSGIVFYTAKNEFSFGALFNTILVVLIAQFIIIIFLEKIFQLLFGFSFYIDIKFTGLAFWGGLYIVSILLKGYLSAIYIGLKWFTTLNVLTVVINIVLIIMLGMLLLRHASISIEHTVLILKIYIFIIFLQAILNLVVLLKKIKFRPSFTFLKLSDTKKLFAYSGIAFFCNLFQFLAYRMDYWFIDFFQDKNELGLYALASKLNQVLWMLPATVAAVIIPFAATSSAELTTKVKTIVRILFNGYILLAAILALAAPFFIPLIFGELFSGSVLPFIILLPGVIIFSINTMLAAFFAGTNQQRINLKISFFSFLIIFAGDLVLVPLLGIRGAATASCIGYAFSGFCALIVFSKQTGWGFKELLFVRKEDITALKNIFFVNYP